MSLFAFSLCKMVRDVSISDGQKNLIDATYGQININTLSLSLLCYTSYLHS